LDLYNYKFMPLDWLIENATGNDSQAQLELYIRYKYGKNDFGSEKNQKNLEEALKWCELSANNNNDIAQLNLAQECLDGDNIPKDYQKALYWLTKSAENSNSKAQYLIGLFYFDEKYIKRNLQKALFWLIKASENNDAAASLTLGKLYYEGQLVNRDITKAIHFLEKRGYYSYNEAMFYLGLCYLYSDESTDLMREGIHLLNESARQEYAYSQYALSLCYSYGFGVDNNLEIAWMYLNKAVSNGYTQACFIDVNLIRNKILEKHGGRITEEEEEDFENEVSREYWNWIQEACNLNDIKALQIFGDYYLKKGEISAAINYFYRADQAFDGKQSVERTELILDKDWYFDGGFYLTKQKITLENTSCLKIKKCFDKIFSTNYLSSSLDTLTDVYRTSNIPVDVLKEMSKKFCNNENYRFASYVVKANQKNHIAQYKLALLFYNKINSPDSDNHVYSIIWSIIAWLNYKIINKKMLSREFDDSLLNRIESIIIESLRLLSVRQISLLLRFEYKKYIVEYKNPKKSINDYLNELDGKAKTNFEMNKEIENYINSSSGLFFAYYNVHITFASHIMKEYYPECYFYAIIVYIAAINGCIEMEDVENDSTYQDGDTYKSRVDLLDKLDFRSVTDELEYLLSNLFNLLSGNDIHFILTYI